MATHRAELTLSNPHRVILNAMRMGARDARMGRDDNCERHGAKAKSMWADWYSAGYTGAPLPQEITDKGIEL